MRIKKYIADNYSEALNRVRSEIGEDALILETRTIKSGQVEITAAMEQKRVARPSLSSSNLRAAYLDDSMDWEADDNDKDFKALLMTLLTQTDKARAMGLRDNQIENFKELVESGINESLAVKILQKFDHFKNRTGAESQNKTWDLKGFMKLMMVCNGGINLNGNSQKVVTLVGPTGVGKTTTIAKLAAHFAYRESKKVAIFSLDTYRLGAVEQLRLYGEIMEIPIEICASRVEFKQAMQLHSDKDLILIDTTGKSHSDHSYAAQLKHILKGTPDLETHLVLSVTSQEKILEESFKQFSPLDIDRVLFTKLDEGVCFGSLFNFSIKNRLPFSYFATGQRVPEDIEVAVQDRAISLIFAGNGTKV